MGRPALAERSITSWFVRPTPQARATCRLFCVPFAGVGPSAYRGWADLAGPEIDCVFVQAPGREARFREAPIASVSETVERLCAEIGPWLDRPFALFGHSLGALVAFELARSLRERFAVEPQHLFVSASRAPQLRSPYPPLRALPNEVLLHELDRRYMGSVPDAVLRDAELRDLFLPAIRADLTAVETYEFRPSPPLACGISAFGGSQDATVAASALDGWRNVTAGEFRIRLVDGPHIFLQTARRFLVDAIRADLAGSVAGQRLG